MEFEVTQFLPSVSLPSSGTDSPAPLIPVPAQTTVLVNMHHAACPGCRTYLEALAGMAAEFSAWDARLLVTIPEAPTREDYFRPAFGTVLIDREHQVSTPGRASVLIADRYGHIYDVSDAGAAHDLPAPRQIEEWLKFLGTLCPE